MERLKFIFAMLAFSLLATGACLAFIIGIRDIFGKTTEWKPALFTILLLWAVVGANLAWDHYRQKQNPRS